MWKRWAEFCANSGLLNYVARDSCRWQKCGRHVKGCIFYRKKICYSRCIRYTEPCVTHRMSVQASGREGYAAVGKTSFLLKQNSFIIESLKSRLFNQIFLFLEQVNFSNINNYMLFTYLGSWNASCLVWHNPCLSNWKQFIVIYHFNFSFSLIPLRACT